MKSLFLLLFIVCSSTVFSQNALADSTKIANILNDAESAIKEGEYDKAKSLFSSANEQLQNFKNYELQAKYYGDQGIMNFYQGDFNAAYKKFEYAYKEAVKHKHTEDQMRYLNNMGAAMSYQGDLKGSIIVHEKSIKLAQKLKDTAQLAQSYNNLGLVYDEMKAYDRALNFYEKSLRYKKQLGLKEEALTTRVNIAGVKSEMGKKDKKFLYEALEDNKAILKDAKALNNGKSQLQALNNIAAVYSSLGEKRKAISEYEKLFVIAEQEKDMESYRTAALNLGMNHYQRKEYEKAEKYLLIAEPLIQENGISSEKANLNKYLARHYKSKGNLTKAYGYLENFTEINDSLASNSLQDKIADFEIKYETAEKERKILDQKAKLAENQLELQRRNQLIYGGLAAALALALLGYLFYRLQQLKNTRLEKEIELERAMAVLETQNKLQDQRLHISRDLHDNIGSQLTFMVSSLDNLKYAQNVNKEVTNDKLSALSGFIRNTMGELRDTIWAMNKGEISLNDLTVRTATTIAQFNDASNGDMTLKTNFENKENPVFSAVSGMHIFRIIQEAINNAVKYSQATDVIISTSENSNSETVIEIKDNGNGFDLTNHTPGNGLKNMQDRAALLPAKLEIKSSVGEGTNITLTVS